ncbi:hypothetical protein [Solilutibacter silvestris]|uniref:hypothetical protein n=1 Tax=Solilutibacter silvestris TaxID=1645665 RepID=UPI003D34ABEF
MPLRLALIALVALPLVACNGNKPTGTGVATSDDPDTPRPPLPRPQADGRPITGMPDARMQPAAVAPDAVATAAAPTTDPATLPPSTDDDATPPPATPAASAENGAQGMVIGDTAEPTIDDGMRVVRDYYDAINRGAYDRAYALWSDHGAASGKTLQQFSDGFADTARDSVDIQRPSTVDAAAGSRYLEIPVRVIATRRDQGSSTYSGSYVLRRSVVDGASAEQRKWRIQSARLQKDD